MNQATSFDPELSIILVEGLLWGPLGRSSLRLILDTGSAETLFVPEVVDALGYSPRDAVKPTSVHSAVGVEHGYITRVARFAALGFEVEDYRVHVFDLAEHYEIDGLLGLSFLRRFNYEIRSADGVILAAPIAA